MGRKRIYLGLMVLSLFLFIACTAMIWGVSYRGLQEIHPSLPLLFGAVIILFSASAALLTLLLAISLSFRKGISTGEKALHIWIRILYPFSLGLGGILGIDKDRIERSFIEVNNYLVQSGKPKYLFKDILLLMPHCLQDSECPVRITHEVKNCRSCGRCNVADLLAIAEARGAHLRVASGGTSARRFVLDCRPEAVIAVACERDLTSGIRESFPLPVIGVVNERPHGDCFNTRVNLSRVKQAIFLLTGKDKEEKG